jgi:hypothetical protein
LNTALASAATAAVVHSGGSCAKLYKSGGKSIQHLPCKKIYFRTPKPKKRTLDQAMEGKNNNFDEDTNDTTRGAGS